MKRGERELRIIGGSLRGRKIRFAADPAIRPTPDRVRETLFNWLQQYLSGARCMDLFAGSGALGLEALSRGASRVVFVDTSSDAIIALRDNVTRFGAAGAEFVVNDAQRQVRSPGGPFDVVFLDPPFDSGLAGSLLASLAASHCLARGALVYVELPRRTPLPGLPDGWSVHRQGQAGEVGYYLLSTTAQGLS